MPSLAAARSDMLTAFRTRWNADTPAVNGGQVPVIHYDGVQSPALPPKDAAWARISIRHAEASQGSLSDAGGSRRFDRIGTLTVESFTPLETARGLILAQDLATIARRAFEGVKTAAGVWFRGVSTRERGVDEAWYKIDVVAEFIYDEFV